MNSAKENDWEKGGETMERFTHPEKVARVEVDFSTAVTNHLRNHPIGT